MGIARVILMGTPDFAVPTLRELTRADKVEVVLVVTQPDRPVGRKHTLSSPPVKIFAEKLGLPVFQPQKVRTPDALAHLAAFKPDVFVTAAYGQILPQRLLDIAPYGCLNVHASLLPRWRGAAPIHRAIIAGDVESGVTIMKTVKELDAGPILGAVKVPVAQDDNVGHLHDELAEEGARLLARLLPAYMAGELTPFAQPCDGITYANRILREDEWLDFTRRAEEVHNQIRGLSPNPGASTLFEGQTFKVFMSRLNPMDGRSNPQSGLSNDEVPGTCMETPAGGLIVRTGDGWLEVLEVQPAGKRRMSAIDWFRGQRGCKVILKSPELVQ